MKKNDLRTIVPADFFLMSKDELLNLKTVIMAFLHKYHEVVYWFDHEEIFTYAHIEFLLHELDKYIKELSLEEINEDIIDEIINEFDGLDRKVVLDRLGEKSMLFSLDFLPIKELVYIPKFEEMPDPDDDRACIKALEKIFH